MSQRRTTRRRRANPDGAWKRVLADLLPDVLAFVVPEMLLAVDWSVPPVSLDKEFQAVARRAGIGPRIADLIVQLRLRSGELTWLVLHVEVQGQSESGAPSGSRGADVRLLRAAPFAPPTTAGHRGISAADLGLALLSDSNADWRPEGYEARAFDRGVRYDYWAVKLLDWRARTAELAASANPFAVVVQAWLGVLAARGRADDLVAVAGVAFRCLRRGGYNDEETAAILAFLEMVLVAPDDEQDILFATLLELEDELMAQVMSRWERSGLRKGRKEGREEERRELLLRLLEHKFGPPGEALTARIQALSGARLLALYDAVLDFTDAAEVESWLEADDPRQP